MYSQKSQKCVLRNTQNAFSEIPKIHSQKYQKCVLRYPKNAFSEIPPNSFSEIPKMRSQKSQKCVLRNTQNAFSEIPQIHSQKSRKCVLRNSQNAFSEIPKMRSQKSRKCVLRNSQNAFSEIPKTHSHLFKNTHFAGGNMCLGRHLHVFSSFGIRNCPGPAMCFDGGAASLGRGLGWCSHSLSPVAAASGRGAMTGSLQIAVHIGCNDFLKFKIRFLPAENMPSGNWKYAFRKMQTLFLKMGKSIQKN